MTTFVGGGDERSTAGRNRLAGSTSPYLLQHKDNPVNWFAWGQEALQAARLENKPIFLSIGYSACHWCHVMEEESFEDPSTAALMNRYFISIKVDREERPDLDDIYMTAVQMLTGSGGWPMSVWLTPELKPFYGGTYFPKDSRYGRPSFTQILTALGEGWLKDQDSLKAQADKVHDAVVQYMSDRGKSPGRGAASAGAALAGAPTARDLIGRAITEMSSDFDHLHGGFGRAPKFPPHRGLVLLLARHRQTKDENLIRMASLTFDRMAQGGMYDQIGGGFHRYSTDAKWLVPHFEKMLYDNALLADAYIDAWQTTGDDLYQRVTKEIFDWVKREMTDPGGAFYSTLDADSEGEEGRFYVWRPEEILTILGEDQGKLVNEYYGITPQGNFEGGASIPHVDEPPERFAERKKIALPDLMRRLAAARSKLLVVREKRARPHLDDKVLTAWNGLMIAALARGARAFDEPRRLEAAVRAADFILKNLRAPGGLLRVSFRQGQVSSEGFLDDQAFFLKGLIELHAATGDARWLKEAQALVKATDADFWDPTRGGYYFTPPDRKDLIVRPKNPTDGAIPSGNSVMAASLLALHKETGDAAYRKRAEEIFAAYSGSMEATPSAFHNMLAALDESIRIDAGAAVTKGVVSLTARAESDEVAPGETVPVVIAIEIQKGWHINSAAPTLPYLIPTGIALAPGGVSSLEGAGYPEGRMISLGFAGKPISVYEGSQRIHLTLRIDRGASEGTHEAKGWLTYQACNDRACLPPGQLSFVVPLKVRAASRRG